MIFSGKFVVDFSGSDRLFATQLSRFLITVWLFWDSEKANRRKYERKFYERKTSTAIDPVYVAADGAVDDGQFPL